MPGYFQVPVDRFGVDAGVQTAPDTFVEALAGFAVADIDHVVDPSLANIGMKRGVAVILAALGEQTRRSERRGVYELRVSRIKQVVHDQGVMGLKR